jgi:hypothetical protein
MIIWLFFFLFLQTRPSFPLCLPGPSWTFLLLRIQSLQCLWETYLLNYCWILKLLSGQNVSFKICMLTSILVYLAAFVFGSSVFGKIFHRWIWNWYRQKLLAGTSKQNNQIFNEDFYFPLYLCLWHICSNNSWDGTSIQRGGGGGSA